MNIKAVLFDMDGIILDSEKVYTRFWREAACLLGYPMTHEQALGMRSQNSIAGAERIRSYFGENASYQAIRDKRIELMDDYVEKEGIELKPGIYPLLKYLKENGIKTAIATSSPLERAKRYLAPYDLEKEFDEVFTGYMVERGKPEPDIYIYAAKQLGVETENCLVLEDSPSGIKAGNSAGCVTVMIPDQDEPDEELMKLLFAKVDSLEAVIGLLEEMKSYQHKKGPQEVVLHDYKSFTINNRRYLGNKFKLIPFIRSVVEEECEGVNTVADIFAGTGSVASAFTDKKLITNDNMYSNYICHVAWFSPQEYSFEKINEMILEYNSMVIAEDNYMSQNFADTYFAAQDCRKIGFIREDIEVQFQDGLINERERALLITSLLYAMDKIANTCGHYDAYRQGVKFEKHLELAVPLPEQELNPNNVFYNTDTNELMKEIEADLVYIDPPYNSRQYCDAYHLLENVAKWEKPEVFGVARKMDRSNLKSDYCTKSAAKAFEELIDSIQAKYILLSYSNMAEKGDGRSNAKISDEDIFRILEKKGTVEVFSESYRAFSAGKSNITGHEERLFLCTCENTKKKVIPSALNYTGGKFKLLPQLLPLFPKKMDYMVDLFCGGCSVGINLECNRVLFNDSDEHLMGLLNTLKRMDKEETFSRVLSIIEEYGLSMVSENGYDFYKCNSGDGLANYNRAGYNRLREDFNEREEKDNEYYLKLYVLIVYAFNNQLRFNRKGEFNLPVGKRDFNAKMQEKLLAFIDRIKAGDYRFTCLPFEEVPIDKLTKDSFVYADPPYLIACATYNEQNGWTEKDELRLLEYLDMLHLKGIRFALSNLLENKGNHNHVLERWLNERPEYQLIDLNYSYNNSNYHGNKENKTREVLIINY